MERLPKQGDAMKLWFVMVYEPHQSEPRIAFVGLSTSECHKWCHQNLYFPEGWGIEFQPKAFINQVSPDIEPLWSEVTCLYMQQSC